MKRTYEKPAIDFIPFDSEDIVAESTGCVGTEMYYNAGGIFAGSCQEGVPTWMYTSWNDENIN